jgi:hypothetical protein
MIFSFRQKLVIFHIILTEETQELQSVTGKSGPFSSFITYTQINDICVSKIGYNFYKSDLILHKNLKNKHGIHDSIIKFCLCIDRSQN